jgi:winged helix DNA-binding protein
MPRARSEVDAAPRCLGGAASSTFAPCGRTIVRAVSTDAERLTLGALNRALLARQGLLERLGGPLVENVEAVGALQAQHWPALPIALWSRVDGFMPSDLYRELERGKLVSGTLLRTTLHLVSAREHPAYAAVAREVADWRRSKAKPTPTDDALVEDLVAYAKRTPRTGEEVATFAEEWLEAHPDAVQAQEVTAQRERKWRPIMRWHGFVRVPADGEWRAKAPSALRAAPVGRKKLDAEAALDEVVVRHLRAFGPAGPEDVAGWIGWRTPPVRDAFARLKRKLRPFLDDAGRTVHDLPDAARPDPETPAPPRFLAPFDSVLLAYASKRRARILPDKHRDAVYERANLRILPTYLVDGRVAGTWSFEVKRREATLTLRPLEKLPRDTRAALVDEGERLARMVAPEAQAHGAVVAR